LNGTRQPLVCADNVNVTEALLEASGEVGLEVNTDRTYQTAEQNHN